MTAATRRSALRHRKPDGTPVYERECPDCGAMVLDSPDGWSNHDHDE